MTLREYLGKESSELYTALDNSWKIAEKQWIPAIAASSGSYNSSPHMKNLETHLDQLLYGCGSIKGWSDAVSLSGVEAYLLLSAILFHDIGRINDADNHGRMSGHKIKQNWSALGIESAELAYSLGDICWYHDCTPEERRKLEKKLCNTVIDPYGHIREPLIAALLTLADTLDGAYTRAQPAYIRESTGVKGAFRSIVRGIFADPGSQMIKTIISSEIVSGEAYPAMREFLEKVEIHKTKETVDAAAIEPYAATAPSLLIRRICDSIDDGDNMGREKFVSYLPLMRYIKEKKKNLVSRNEKDNEFRWPPPFLLAIIMNDVEKNAGMLQVIREGLYSVGLNFKAWLIEYNDHLYAFNGKESFEPIFSKEYLKNVICTIYALSKHILGTKYFTYENLAIAARDTDLERVKAAVRRLSIVITGKPGQGDCILKFNDTHWYIHCIKSISGPKLAEYQKIWLDAVEGLEDASHGCSR